MGTVLSAETSIKAGCFSGADTLKILIEKAQLSGHISTYVFRRELYKLASNICYIKWNLTSVEV